MKYMVLIYSNPATWADLPAEEADRVIGVHNDLIGELTDSGELVSSSASTGWPTPGTPARWRSATGCRW